MSTNETNLDTDNKIKDLDNFKKLLEDSVNWYNSELTNLDKKIEEITKNYNESITTIHDNQMIIVGQRRLAVDLINKIDDKKSVK